MSILSEICTNLQEVREEIEEARRHSLTGEEVKLIAVTKTHPVEKIQEAIDCGVTDIGENKVQELTPKIKALKSQVSYHMIGNLQSNKVKYIYQDVSLIHSLDRKSLAKEINKRGKKTDTLVHCLVQVNISREDTKGGVMLEDAVQFIETLLDYDYLKVDGLMGMAPHTDDEKVLRKCFRDLFALKEDIAKRNYEGIDMDILSMGMSNDYKIAVEEGSNMVRVGSRIFGKRVYK